MVLFDSNTFVRRDFVDVQHRQLHYRQCGQSGNPVVVLLHMMPKSSRSFTRLMPCLADNYFVIAPDFPGCGESDHFAESTPTIQNYVSALSEFLNVRDISNALFVGYHTGAMVATELAHRTPDLVSGLVCISAPVATQEQATLLEQEFKPIPLDAQGTRYTRMWQRMLHYAGPDMTLEMCAESMAENLRGGERYEDGHFAAFAYMPKFARRLTSLKVPFHVLNIGDDLYPMTKAIQPQVAASSYTERAEWGNGFLSAQAEEFAGLLRQVFASFRLDRFQ